MSTYAATKAKHLIPHSIGRSKDDAELIAAERIVHPTSPFRWLMMAREVGRQSKPLDTRSRSSHIRESDSLLHSYFTLAACDAHVGIDINI